MYKRLETTKQELEEAMDDLFKMVGNIRLDISMSKIRIQEVEKSIDELSDMSDLNDSNISKINRQVGKLQTLVKYLPHDSLNYTDIRKQGDYIVIGN